MPPRRFLGWVRVAWAVPPGPAPAAPRTGGPRTTRLSLWGIKPQKDKRVAFVLGSSRFDCDPDPGDADLGGLLHPYPAPERPAQRNGRRSSRHRWSAVGGRGRSAIAGRCHPPTESARAARQRPAARATDAERTRGTTTLRVRPVNGESRPTGRLPADRLSSAPPVRPVRPVTCPADRAPPAAASRPAVPVALSLGSLGGFPFRPATQSLSSQPPAITFLGNGVQGVGQDARQG
jgi:hypothetical protein